MSLIYGQIAAYVNTTAGLNQTAYTVPASNRFVGQIIVVNTSPSTSRSYRLAILKSGDSIGAEHYVAYDAELLPQESTTVTGVTLGAGDQVILYSDFLATTAGTGIVLQMYGELDDNV